MMNLERRPLLLTKSVKTPSAAGLLQMLPKHTKRTENGLVLVVSVFGVEAIDDLIMGVCLTNLRLCLCGCRDGYCLRNGDFKES